MYLSTWELTWPVVVCRRLMPSQAKVWPWRRMGNQCLLWTEEEARKLPTPMHISRKASSGQAKLGSLVPLDDVLPSCVLLTISRNKAAARSRILPEFMLISLRLEKYSN